MGEQGCPFCGRRLDRTTRSKEHVIPKWVHSLPGIVEAYQLPENSGQRRLIAGVTVETTPFNEVVIATDLRHATRKSLHEFNLTVPVCRTCNNGWMSALEISAKPTLEALIEGHSTKIPADQASTLIRWAAKTAYAFQTTDPPSATMLEAQRRDLAMGRLPRWVSVAVASCSEPERPILIHGPVTGIPTGTHVGPAVMMGGRSVISVGRVAFFVRQQNLPIELSGHVDTEPPAPWSRLRPGVASNLQTEEINYAHVKGMFGVVSAPGAQLPW